MKVRDIMSKQIDFVTPDTLVKEVCHRIFLGGINTLPICKGNKLVGVITERDILAQFYPTMREYVEDPVHLSDFEQMEKKVTEIFTLKAERIMNRKPTITTEDIPILQVQYLMLSNRVEKIPVVDDKGNLRGTVSKGDIFRAIVGDRLSFVSNEEYHDWLSRHYDTVIDWKKRLGHEIPDLEKLFLEEHIESVIDIGCGTGEHDINLAKKGFRVLGIESSISMHETAKSKLKMLPKEVLEYVEFMQGDYIQILGDMKRKFDAAIFMGNALPHLVKNYKDVLKRVAQILKLGKSLAIFQIINFEKVLKVNNGLLDVNFASSKLEQSFEHMFIEFYDSPGKNGGSLTLSMAIFDFDGKKWKFRSLNSTPIANITQDQIMQILKSSGFENILSYGSNFWSPLFAEPFSRLESDFLNVVARR